MEDYKTYVSQPKEVNTFTGITSFILGTLSMEDYINNEAEWVFF